MVKTKRRMAQLRIALETIRAAQREVEREKREILEAQCKRGVWAGCRPVLRALRAWLARRNVAAVYHGSHPQPLWLSRGLLQAPRRLWEVGRASE